MSSKSRALTAGEIRLAKKVYKFALDYSLVKIHDGKYAFFQPSQSGMTPNGEIYVDGVYMSDYSKGVPAIQGFFIHEMAHVYQHQLKILNPIFAAISESFMHGFDYAKAYHYTLDANKDLLDYEIEQQAAIIEDYFRVAHLNLSPVKGHMQNSYPDVVKNGLFVKVLKKFLVNPAYAKHEVVCNTRKLGKNHHKTCARVLVK